MVYLFGSDIPDEGSLIPSHALFLVAVMMMIMMTMMMDKFPLSWHEVQGLQGHIY